VVSRLVGLVKENHFILSITKSKRAKHSTNNIWALLSQFIPKLSNFLDNQQDNGWVGYGIVEHPNFLFLSCPILFLEFVSLSQGGGRQAEIYVFVGSVLYVDEGKE
jgi:hypothetical protein